MITLEGSYHDGVTSRSFAARLSVPGVPGTPLKQAKATLIGSEIDEQIPLADIVVNARVGSMPRRISWGTAGSFTTSDNEAADALQYRLSGSQMGLLAHRLERNLPLAVGALLVVAAVLVGVMFWGVPYAARSLAGSIPEPVARSAAEQTLATLDQVYFDPSVLSDARQSQLRAYLRGYDSYAKKIEFRTGGEEIGANALALPGGFVVITDELVALAQHDEELLSVYLHEVGHARGHHAEASVLQSSAWIVLLTFLTGDIGGVTETIYTLPVVIGQLAFSREFEREADEYAIAALQRSNIDIERLATMLERLEQAAVERSRKSEENGDKDAAEFEVPDDDAATLEERQGVGFLEYLSTHPATSRRIARIRAAAPQAGQGP